MIAYFDCFSGISGDMIVGALMGAGVPVDWLERELKKLPLTGYSLEKADVTRGGIAGTRFRVNIEAEEDERNLREICSIINRSTLPQDVRELSIRVFERLAEGEAKVHNVGVDDIHFHEVGAVDSIIDIVSASLALSYLGITDVYASEIPLSYGSISCSHGLLPSPAPATIEMLKGMPVYQSLIKGELVTPTGAAFLAVTCKGFGVMPTMRLDRAGYGAGDRENEGLPNLLRVLIGEYSNRGDRPGFMAPSVWGVESGLSPDSGMEADSVTVIETNIDDMNPEIYGFVMERLFDMGALDVTLTSLHMKKGRPGTMITVICEPGNEKVLADLLLRETSTIGVRSYRAERLKLQRKSIEVMTKFGKVKIKMAKTAAGNKAQPEYDDCSMAALEHGVPVKEVYIEATKEFERGSHA